MAAGLYLHIVDGIDDALLVPLVDAAGRGVDGPVPFVDLRPEHAPDDVNGVVERLASVERVLLGEGPWGDDALDARPLPTPLARIGETLPARVQVVDEALTATILGAYDQADSHMYRLGRPGDIWQFLRRHQGERVLVAIRSDEQAAEREYGSGTSAGAASATEASPTLASTTGLATADASMMTPAVAGAVATPASSAPESDGRRVAVAAHSGDFTGGRSSSEPAPDEPAPDQPAPDGSASSALALGEPDEPAVAHDPAFRRPIPTVDGFRPLALVLVVTGRRAPSSGTWRERLLAVLATIGTLGAGLAAAAGLNSLFR